MNRLMSQCGKNMPMLIVFAAMLWAISMSISRLEGSEPSTVHREAEPIDIAKDSLFVASLREMLPMYYSAFVVTEDDPEIVPEERITASHLAMMQDVLKQVLSEELLPEGTDIESLHYRGISTTQHQQIVTELTKDELQIWVSYSPGAYLTVRVHVTPALRVQSSPFEDPGQQALLKLIRRLLRVPYDSPEDIDCHGKRSSVAGTVIYSGEINRKGVNLDQLVKEGKYDEITPFDRVYVLVSDSMPQYAVFRLWIPDPEAKGWARRPVLFRGK